MVYTHRTPEFDEADLEQFPDLKDRNRSFVFGPLGDYSILDALEAAGYLAHNSNRRARWHKIFLTEYGEAEAAALAELLHPDIHTRSQALASLEKLCAAVH